MNEWKLVQRDPSENLARLHFFSVKKKHAGGEIEARITVKEFVTFKTSDMAFFASADVELNQKTMKFQPCGWSETLAGALSEGLRNLRKFDYETDEQSAALPSDCGRQAPTHLIQPHWSSEPVFTPRPIGYVRSPYTDTKSIPKGLGVKHDVEGTLEILPEFEVGLTDIEGFSHIFVIWAFDRSEGYDLFGPSPADNRPHGVFATRSPRRPNPIALTVLELLGHEGPKLIVRGLDMLDGTPILDIKPYMSSIPAENLRRGWLAEAELRREQGPSDR